MAENPTGLLEVAGPEDAVVDIVFVHGVTGDRESSWTSKNNIFWLLTLLPQAIPNARILTWGYDNRIFGVQSMLDDSTIEMCNALMAKRAHKFSRPIIFVGHDLGALLCSNVICLGREALFREVYDTKIQAVFVIENCVRGIIFLGMPVTAPTVGEWRDLQSRGLIPSPQAYSDFHASKYVDLFMYSHYLSRTVLDDFWGHKERINTFSFYEDDDVEPLGKVITKDMATPPDKSYEPLSIPGNHETMCQFDSNDEPGYIMIKWLLQKWIRELSTHMSGDLVDPTEPSTVTDIPALDTPSELHILHELLGLSKEHATNTSEDSKERSEPLLSPEIVRWLASKELLISIHLESLTISTAPLLESFTISKTDSSSTEGYWSLSEEDKPFLRKVDIPIRLHSVETYEFIGYRRNIAEYLWEAFSSSLNPSFSLLEVSKEYLKDNLRDLEGAKGDWNDVMSLIGIGDSLRTSVIGLSGQKRLQPQGHKGKEHQKNTYEQDTRRPPPRSSIFDPHFKNVRSTDSCGFWLRNAFEIRWQELQALKEDLLKVMKRAASTGEQPTELGSSALSHDPGTKTQQSQSSQHQDTAQPLAEQGSGGKKEKVPMTETTPATKTLEFENEEVTLWRGGAKVVIESAIVKGELCLDQIRSVPGDFSGSMRSPYFTTQRKTAEQYGAFHRLLSVTRTPAYLLSFKVGKEWLRDLRHRCLWATNRMIDTCDIGMSSRHDQEVQGAGNRSWEHVVLACRRGTFTPSILQGQDLAIGHIAAFHTEDIDRMQSEADISAEMFLIDNIPAVQYAFISELSQKQLVTNAREVKTECLRGKTVLEGGEDSEGRIRVDDVRYQPLG